MDPSSEFSDVLAEVSFNLHFFVSQFLKTEALTAPLTHFLMQVKTRLAHLPNGDMTNPLLNTALNTEQWVGCQSCV